MNRQLASLLTVLMLVLFSGCLFIGDDPTNEGGNGEGGPTNPWNVDIFVTEYEAETGGNFSGGVAVGGRVEGNLSSISLQFLNEDEDVVKEVPVGDLNLSSDYETRTVNTTLPTVPVYVTASIDSAEVANVSQGHLEGIHIQQDGEMDMYRVEDYREFIDNASE